MKILGDRITDRDDELEARLALGRGRDVRNKILQKPILNFKDKDSTGFWKAKHKGWEYTISLYRGSEQYYVVASHLKKDIRLNTLWMIGHTECAFSTFEAAAGWCEKFDYRNYIKYCLGDDK